MKILNKRSRMNLLLERFLVAWFAYIHTHVVCLVSQYLPGLCVFGLDQVSPLSSNISEKKCFSQEHNAAASIVLI